jgi:hypothetical protein
VIAARCNAPIDIARSAGQRAGWLHAAARKPDDSHAAWCLAYPAEASSKCPTPGLREAFRNAYEFSYAAEAKAQRGGR